MFSKNFYPTTILTKSTTITTLNSAQLILNHAKKRISSTLSQKYFKGKSFITTTTTSSKRTDIDVR